jgi:hypothetical protein
MDWQQIMNTVAELQKAHAKQPLAEQARIIDNHFKEHPVMGWLLLRTAHAGGALDDTDGHDK